MDADGVLDEPLPHFPLVVPQAQKPRQKSMQVQRLRRDLVRQALKAKRAQANQAEKAEKAMAYRVKLRAAERLGQQGVPLGRIAEIMSGLRLRSFGDLKPHETLEDLEEDQQVKFFAALR